MSDIIRCLMSIEAISVNAAMRGIAKARLVVSYEKLILERYGDMQP
jgi:hypothetical protein